MKWSKVPFESLYSIPSKNGLTRPARVRGQGYKMINMGELFANDHIGNIPMDLVPMNDKELQSMLVEKDDLLFARQSLVLAGAGKCSLVTDIEEPTTFESHLIRVRLNKVEANPEFYFYYFRSPLCAIKTIVTQGVQAGIRGNDLKKLPVHLPDIDTQNRIAGILRQYDDLIENNRRRIQLLEESARLLYQEWFVHLRFPGHEHVKVVDGVPEGWQQKQLCEVAAVNEQSLKKGYQERIEYIDISCVSTHSINGTEWYDFADAPGRARRVLKHKDILWSCVRPNRRSHALVFEPHENLIASTGFAVISAKTVSPLYLYQALTTNDYVGYLTNRAGGAAYPAVTGKVFEQSTLTVPTDNLIADYEQAAHEIYQQIWTLNQSNEKLAQARDLLLPRLMNGELL